MNLEPLQRYIWSLIHLGRHAIQTCDEDALCPVCERDHDYKTFLNRENYCDRRTRNHICGELEMLKGFVEAGGVLDAETLDARMKEVQSVTD